VLLRACTEGVCNQSASLPNSIATRCVHRACFWVVLGWALLRGGTRPPHMCSGTVAASPQPTARMYCVWLQVVGQSACTPPPGSTTDERWNGVNREGFRHEQHVVVDCE
jgi:hypothetical protein